VRALAVCALLLAVWPAAALADAEVRVEAEGSAPATLRLSQLGTPDVQGADYGLGAELLGHSLDRVLSAARVDPYRYGDVEVETAAGSATLSRDDVTGAEPPPAIFEDGAGARFVPGAGEAPLAAGGAPIVVRLERPGELRVTARASRTRVRRREEVTFTATVTGADAGEAVQISWYFDDGRSASGSRVTHRFRRRGSYDVVVGATTAADEAGADATVTVQVGKAPDGPDRKGGGTNADAEAPDSGAATGAAGDAGAGGGTAPGAAEESPARPDRRKARPQRRREKRQPPRPRRREPPVRTTGAPKRVAGTELADLSALTAPAGADAVAAARRGRPQDEPGGPVPPIVWWSLGGLGLLVAGGWREGRQA
jgi:hypothetical protein